jgi:hypothetical protein
MPLPADRHTDPFSRVGNPLPTSYERGVDLVAIQQMLGHWHVGTTMRYVTPSATFIEDAYRKAVSGALSELGVEQGED